MLIRDKHIYSRLLKQHFISPDFDADNIDPSFALEKAMQHLQ